ncbi:MAG: DUF721 domain-containing protein [Sciscionella sp.]|nr:DUF721 domain-containing protein [Sciscionella sp.]
MGEPSPGVMEQSAGSDIARAALRAAQASAKARGGRRVRSSGSATINARRRRRWSGPRADDRDPQPLGRLTEKLTKDRGWSKQLAGGQLFARWTQLVGEEIAEHVRPVRLEDGELVVRAESTAWATQLRLLQRQLLHRIATALGDDVVRRIKVQGPTTPSWRYGPRHIPGRGPRDTYG